MTRIVVIPIAGGHPHRRRIASFQQGRRKSKIDLTIQGLDRTEGLVFDGWATPGVVEDEHGLISVPADRVHDARIADDGHE